MQAKFYEKLYQSDTTIEFKFSNNKHGKLSDEKPDATDAELNLQELTHVLKTMQGSKSPGCDGIGYEFY